MYEKQLENAIGNFRLPGVPHHPCPDAAGTSPPHKRGGESASETGGENGAFPSPSFLRGINLAEGEERGWVLSFSKIFRFDKP